MGKSKYWHITDNKEVSDILGIICNKAKPTNPIYKIKDESYENVMTITVCEITIGDNSATGFSLCSRKDQFSRKLGRTIAQGRAMAIMDCKETIGWKGVFRENDTEN